MQKFVTQMSPLNDEIREKSAPQHTLELPRKTEIVRTRITVYRFILWVLHARALAAMYLNSSPGSNLPNKSLDSKLSGRLFEFSW